VTASAAPEARPPRRVVGWLAVLRHYLAFMGLVNLAWEIAQLPLYTIWTTGTRGEIAWAVVHCTVGDVLIAGAALLLALVVLRADSWPHARYLGVALLAVALGFVYTAYSEWLNTSIRQTWTYSAMMPVIPPGIGVSPLVQWLVIPSLGLRWARP